MQRNEREAGELLIAAIADTHIPDKDIGLPKELEEKLRAVDLILHAGDFTTLHTLERLRTFAPVEAVCGNVDETILKWTLPRVRVVQAGAYRIGLVHGDGSRGTTVERARRSFDRVDCIVFGHSHSPYLQRHHSVLMLNPGSPTDKRRAPHPSYALITVDDTLSAEIVYLPEPTWGM